MLYLLTHSPTRSVSVNTPEPYNCQSSSSQASVDVTVGYILGPPAPSSSTGVLGCPWRVTASEGQRINLTLYDFGETRLGVVASSTSSSSSSSDDAEPEWDALDAAAARKAVSASSAAVCHRYAVVADVMARTDIDICSSPIRFSHAYTSIGNSLEIRMLRKQASAQQQQQVTVGGGTFVLRYEGKTTTITFVGKDKWSFVLQRSFQPCSLCWQEMHSSTKVA